MFSYRHIYHAGNFADVFKHILLIGLFESLQRKETGLCFHDTHAGIGLYDLHSEQAQKNREFEEGAERLLDVPGLPSWAQVYVDIIRAVNSGEALDYYPGSPMVARRLLRPQDAMVLTELNKADHALLKQGFTGDKQVAVHLQDAWQGLKALLPPRLKRGLVLIDPPYELKTEIADMVNGLRTANARWSSGIYAIWYPIFEDEFAEKLHKKIIATGIRKILDCHLIVRQPKEGGRMIGTGMLIINPPWQFDEHVKEILPWLQGRLAQDGNASHRVEWLVGE